MFSKRLLDISDDIMILEPMSSGSNGFFPCKSKVGGVVVGSRPIHGVCVCKLPIYRKINGIMMFYILFQIEIFLLDYEAMYQIILI